MKRQQEILWGIKCVMIGITVFISGGCVASYPVTRSETQQLYDNPPNVLDRYSESEDESFVVYWLSRMVGKADGISTIYEDNSNGAFTLVFRRLLPNRRVQYSVYFRDHRVNEIQYKAFAVQYNKWNKINDFFGDIRLLINGTDSDEGLVAYSGPMKKHHLDTKSGRSISGPAGGLSTYEYEIFELASYDYLNNDDRREMWGLGMHGVLVELMVNELDAFGETVR